MALLSEIWSVIQLLIAAFKMYQKARADGWSADLLAAKDALQKAKTSEEMKDAAQKVSALVARL